MSYYPPNDPRHNPAGQQPGWDGQQQGYGYNQPQGHGQPPGYGQAPGFDPYQQGHGQATTPEDRNWALAAHVGSIVTAWVAMGLIAPLIVMLVQGPKSPFVRRHAVESLNFQINALVITVVLGVLSGLLIGIPFLIAYGIFYLVVVIMATIKASQGEEWRYPMTVRVIT